MCTKLDLQAILSAIYEKSVAEFGNRLETVILYGSYARGDYTEESDIDVLVLVDMDRMELESHRRKMSALANNLDLRYDAFVSIKLQDHATFNEYKNALPFYQNVLKDGVGIGA